MSTQPSGPPPPPGPPPSPSPTYSGHLSGAESSSNLYLITFLATLFLLLFVSCGIVLRSYILRRRYQRRLEEALGTGLLLAPRAQGSKRKRFGTKPKMVNTWLTEGGEKWNQMMPLSAQPVFVKRKIRESSAVKPNTPSDTTPTTVLDVTTAAADSSNPPTEPLTGSNRMTNLFSRFCRSPSNNIEGSELVQPNANGAKQPSSGTTPNYRIRVEMLQLSVLISMPSQNKSQRKNHILEKTDLDRDEEEDEESELPNMVFGVTRVNYRQPKPTPTPPLLPKPTDQSDVVVS